MGKIKCSSCGEMVEPIIFKYRNEEEVKLDYGHDVQIICPKCRAVSVPRKTIFAALEAFENGKFTFKAKTNNEQEGSMEKIKCYNCDSMKPYEFTVDNVFYAFKNGRFELKAKTNNEQGDSMEEVKSQQQSDMVNHPNHYLNENGVECQDVIDYVLKNVDVTKTAAYWLGCSIKYLFRYKRKGKPIQDLSKARFCFDRAIDYLKKDVEGENNED